MTIIKLVLASRHSAPRPFNAQGGAGDAYRHPADSRGEGPPVLRSDRKASAKQDLANQKTSDFTPDDPDVPFYLGQTNGGTAVGVVLFQQIDSPHGPLEIGLAIGPDGAVTAAAVTTATVETKPWVLEATAADLMRGFAGMREGDDPRKALARTQPKLGGMPEYMAELIATAVGRGLVLYGTLYQQSAT
jgi:hypothetical protein